MITSAPDGGEGDDDRLPKDVTVHWDKNFKAGGLLVPKDMSERLLSQYYKTSNLHTGATKLRHSLQARFVIPQLKDICKNVWAHRTVFKTKNPANYKAPGESQF